jgi:hypothetical protein
MTGLTDLQRGALDLITMHPLARPITGTEIASRIGLKNSKSREGADLRSVIHALRVKGYPVCASGNGYWWPADGDELKAYIGSLEARAMEVQEAVDGLKAGFQLVGQATGQKKAQEAVVTIWRTPAGVFQVTGAMQEKFLADHPDAERL